MSRFKQVVGLIAPALVLASPVSLHADQPQTITISTSEDPILKDGHLQGCTISFEVGRDHPEYSQGKLAYVAGGLSLMALDRQEPIYVLKLGVKEPGQTEFQAPADAYLLHGLATNKEDFVKRAPGEIPGSALFVFKPGESTMTAASEDLAKNDTLVFGYAMQAGGIDAVVPIDLRVKQLNFDDPAKSQVNDQLVADWTKCVLSVVESAKKLLQHK